MKLFKQSFFNLSIIAILFITFIIGNYVFGWTSAPATPPGGTINPPLDTSSSNQAKQGSLSLATSTPPSYSLDVNGVIRIGQFSSDPSGASGSLYYNTTSHKFKGYTNSGWLEIGGTGLWTASGTTIYYNTGNVGIGTSTPSAKLDIYSSTIPWNALGICKNGVCCPIWKDCDGDGKTYGNGDCDESCPTCYVGSTSYTTSPDGKDQDCDGTVDELGNLLLYMAASTYSGNLGGRSGADSKCDLGATLGCSINRAFINVSTTDEIKDMPTNYNVPTDKPIYWYNRTTGLITLAANNWADLLDGSILVSQTSGTGISKPVWIGGNYDGSICTADCCSSWTSINYSGWIGYADRTDALALGSSGACTGGSLFTCGDSTDITLRCLCWQGKYM